MGDGKEWGTGEETEGERMKRKRVVFRVTADHGTSGSEGISVYKAGS